jgi:cytochrome c biogenesis protein
MGIKMKSIRVFKLQKYGKLLIDLKFAIGILALIAFTSSLGSFIEQDEPRSFYEENYSNPIYGFIDANFILKLGLDHIYTTWWFLSLLAILSFSLIGCTITRQFPLFKNSKEYFFKAKNDSFLNLPFSIKIKNIYYFKETILSKIQEWNFYIYQKGNVIYGYKGLIGRLSPILVHFSLLVILGGSTLGAFENFKAQEILPKGEVFHIQNPLRVGWKTNIPPIPTRINDFWVEYEKNRIHQFYSNISILDNFGNEILNQTISVNNPLRYKNIDFYQSDWNLIGIRVKNQKENKIIEFPLFPLKNNTKSWITWINEIRENTGDQGSPSGALKQEIKTLVFDQLQQIVFIYDEKGNFLNIKNNGEAISQNLIFIDILPSTGLLIKYDPSITIIYFGFGLLMITACLSYLPYTQIWICNTKKNCWIGSSTNRGKIQFEIEFENYIRYFEYQINKTPFIK